MRSFTSVELVSAVDTVKTAAAREPVAITEHRKPKFVLMSIDDYERMRGGQDPNRAYRLEETPDAILDILKDEFNALDAKRLRPHAEEQAKPASRSTHHGRASFETPAARAPQDEDRKREPKIGPASGNA
jgi:Antitoxin Phd_YefM, type II toxin-antitoxin system